MDRTIKISLTAPIYGITFLPLVFSDDQWDQYYTLWTLNRDVLLIALGALMINAPNAVLYLMSTLLNLVHVVLSNKMSVIY